jgi:uroporphyrinogen-III decarboxylase
LESLDEIRKIDLLNAWPVTAFREQVLAMKAKYGESVDVIPPFFWDTSGRATFHGPVTTAQKLMGERFFLEMADNPEFVHEFLDWIVESYILLARHFAGLVNRPITSVHIGDCSACMIGGEQFSEFDREPCAKLIRELGPGRLHSCGDSNHLLEAFHEVPGIGILNMGTNTSVAKARAIFGREVTLDVMPDPKVFCFGKPDECAAWVRQCVEENQSGPLEIQYHLDLGTPEPNALAMHHALREAGFAEHVVEPAV